ncbi:MAG: EscU/YscU/HrcU family type III secretion system export apparatus switch protein [Thermodesulfovibrionales bacterium]
MADIRKKAAALKYAHGEDKAPKLVARGSGAVADRIIEVAKAHGIHIQEDRALIDILSSLDLYQEIPPELYRAVAEILVFVYKLNIKAKA